MSKHDIPVDVDVLPEEIRKTYADVDTYARSAFADTRRKAAKYGAMGSTTRATEPRLSG